jgi:hypothetical protein
MKLEAMAIFPKERGLPLRYGRDNAAHDRRIMECNGALQFRQMSQKQRPGIMAEY